MYYGDAIASYKLVTYSDASIIISFRTDREVAVFVRESTSLVTGKTDTVTRLHLLGPT